MLTAQGGTGNYHYTLSDAANNATGPQDDNHFTVVTGNYTITVTDNNGCSFTTEAIQVDDGTDPCGGIASMQNNVEQADDAKAKNNSLAVHVFPNPSSTAFTLEIQSSSNENVEVIVTDVYGSKVYKAGTGNYNKYSFGKEFRSGTYFINVRQGKNIKTLKIIKEH